ncbi:MAG: hypothetical protein HY663_05790 [Chloroflexi bacterium]|nr:hypothetical protein [Chloroflexota bacterium]
MLPNFEKRGPPPVPYVAIHRATMTPPKESLIVSAGDISLTLTSGPLSFSYSVPMKRFGAGVASMTIGERQINLPSGSYVKIETLIKSFADSDRERVALAIAEAATLITLRYPHLLDNKLFEGVVNSKNAAVMWSEGPMTLTASPSIPPETVAETLQSDFSNIQKLDASDRTRLQLAARWFRRGCEAVNQVDKFLFFWTVLEIYPTKGTIHVAGETANLLQSSIYVNMNTSDVKKNLELGPMHSMRGKIIHAGQAFVEDSEQSIFERRLEKLRATATVCLRLLGGMSPGDDLDRFIK